MSRRRFPITVPTREKWPVICGIGAASTRRAEPTYMTAVLMHQYDWLVDPPTPTPITFILAGHRLVTVRYAEPRAFQIFLNRAQKKDADLRQRRRSPRRPAGSHHRSRG